LSSESGERVVSLEMARVFDRCLRMVRLKASVMPGARVVRKGELRVDGEVVDPKRALPGRIPIVPAEWRKEYNKVVGEAHKVIEEADPDALARPATDQAADDEAARETVSGIPSVKVVAATSLDAKRRRIDRIRERKFVPLVEKYAAGWDEMLAKLRAELGEPVWAAIADRVPTAKEFKDGQYLELQELPLTFVNDIGRRVAYDVAARLVASVADGFSAFAERLAKKVKSREKFLDKSFTDLRQILTVCRDFSFAMPAGVLAQVVAVEEQMAALGEAPAELLNAALARGQDNTEGIVAALTLATSSARDAYGGQFNRRIRLE
jgi:hypothetical protein